MKARVHESSMGLEPAIGLVGRTVASLREVLGWTQQELARRADMSQAMVSAIENGRVKDLTFSRADRLFAAMGGASWCPLTHPSLATAIASASLPTLVARPMSRRSCVTPAGRSRPRSRSEAIDHVAGSTCSPITRRPAGCWSSRSRPRSTTSVGSSVHLAGTSERHGSLHGDSDGTPGGRSAACSCWQRKRTTFEPVPTGRRSWPAFRFARGLSATSLTLATSRRPWAVRSR
jgi:hypothetical protein